MTKIQFWGEGGDFGYYVNKSTPSPALITKDVPTSKNINPINENRGTETHNRLHCSRRDIVFLTAPARPVARHAFSFNIGCVMSLRGRRVSLSRRRRRRRVCVCVFRGELQVVTAVSVGSRTG